MKLNKLFLLMLALPMALVACKDSDAPKVESEYLFDIKMATAERVSEIAEEGVTFEDNQFFIALTDKSESCMATLLIQGEENEETLRAGTYTSARGSLIMESCLLATEDETIYPFEGGEGSVTVTLSEAKVYTIEATFTDANGDKFHFTYEGAIANMSDEDRYFVHENMRISQRCLPAEKYNIKDGDIGLLFSNDSDSYRLAIVLTLEEGNDILTAGTYSTDLGNLHVDEGFYVKTSDASVTTFVSGEVKVTGDVDSYSFDMLFVDAEGKNYHFTYDGLVTWMIYRFEEPEYYGRCFGYYEDSTAYNYVLWFGRNIGIEHDTNASKQRYMLDVYGPKVKKDADGYYKVPNGTYTLDKKSTFDEWTISQVNSYIEIGTTQEVEYEQVTLVVTDECTTITITVEDGTEITMVYNGELKTEEVSDFNGELNE